MQRDCRCRAPGGSPGRRTALPALCTQPLPAGGSSTTRPRFKGRVSTNWEPRLKRLWAGERLSRRDAGEGGSPGEAWPRSPFASHTAPSSGLQIRLSEDSLLPFGLQGEVHGLRTEVRGQHSRPACCASEHPRSSRSIPPESGSGWGVMQRGWAEGRVFLSLLRPSPPGCP